MCDVTAVDGVQHTIWRVDGEDQRELVAAFAAMPTLYIADGHHRAASAALAGQHFRGVGRAGGEWDTFLAVAFPSDQAQILPYNRVVKDLGGQTPDSLLAAPASRNHGDEWTCHAGTEGPCIDVPGGRVAHD